MSCTCGCTSLSRGVGTTYTGRSSATFTRNDDGQPDQPGYLPLRMLPVGCRWRIFAQSRVDALDAERCLVRALRLARKRWGQDR